MLDTFKLSFKLKITYMTNSFLYSIKRIPLIKKIVPDNAYADSTFKAFGTIFSISSTIVKTFLFKFIYFFSIFLLAEFLKENAPSSYYLHILFFFTLNGALIKNNLFDVSNDNYYAIILMHMDANKYAISNYLYFLIKNLLGFILPCLVVFFITDLPLYICLLVPIFITMVKLTFVGINILYIEVTKKVKNILNNKYTVIYLIIFTLLTGLPLLNIVINKELFLIFTIIFIITGILSLIKILNYKNYLKIYKVVYNESLNLDKIDNTKILKETVEGQIEYNSKYNSNKKGYDYFHDLFVKRHNKILIKAVKLQSIIIFIISLAVILFVIFIPDLNKEINNIPLNYLSYFIFLMYSLNRGTIYTQALFMNCDHSMLTYRFFRRPEVILGLFKVRLKTLIKLNLIPSSIIAITLPLVLLLTGGTDNIINYLILFVSIISMSIFFSVHYLVMYYLLQPYNANTELKSGTYKIVQALTYLVCYYMIQIKLPTFYFGISMIIFSIIYSLIALLLAYKLAPNKFKIHN